MHTIMKAGAVAAGAAALVVSGVGFVPAQAAGGLTITTVGYPPSSDEDWGFSPPVVDLTCGFEIEFTDTTPGSYYEVLLSPDVYVETYADFDRASRTGWAIVDCGIAPEALQSGQTYTVTVQEYGIRGLPTESATTEFTYTEVGAPIDAAVVVDGEPADTTLPTGVPVDITYDGEWEPGTTFTTVVSAISADYFEEDWFSGGDAETFARESFGSRPSSVGTSLARSSGDDGDVVVGSDADVWEETDWPFTTILSRKVTGDAPVSRFQVPHHFGGDYLWVSVRAEKAGKAPVVIWFQEPFEIVTSAPTQQFPAAWVRSPGAKSGAAFAGTAVGVTAPSLTHTGAVSEVQPYYQWFLDGRPVPGAKTRLYTPPATAVGRTLTLGVQFAAPGYFPRNGSFNFGTVGQRAVPAAWVRTPAQKSGTARVGSTVAVSAPALTSTAVAQGTKVYYQWFLDGRAVPGATARTYRLPSNARGTTLTVGVAVAKPAWKPLNTTLSFGRVR